MPCFLQPRGGTSTSYGVPGYQRIYSSIYQWQKRPYLPVPSSATGRQSQVTGQLYQTWSIKQDFRKKNHPSPSPPSSSTSSSSSNLIRSSGAICITPRHTQDPVRATSSRFLSRCCFISYKVLLTTYFVFWTIYWPTEDNVDDAYLYVTYWTFYITAICEFFFSSSRSLRVSSCIIFTPSQP